MKNFRSKLILLLGLLLLLFILILISYLALDKNKVITKTEALRKNISVTKNQAESIVKNLPEVKKTVNDRSKEWIVEAFDKDTIWTIHVAQIVKDNEDLSHMATFNWYNLDKKSGKMVCSMFVYDKKGKFTDKVNSCK